MTFLSVLVAGLAGYAVGAVWYMSLAKLWMAAVGKTEEEVKASRNPLPFIIAFLGNVLAAGALRQGFTIGDISGSIEGALAGFMIGLFVTAPWIITNYAFADRPKPLWWIDAGHAVLALLAIGAVLGAFS